MDLPKIEPKWRTDTVVQLCQSMRETQDYSALPILADALQDADCTEEGLLLRLRSGGVRKTEALTVVACIYSEQTYAAVVWLKEFPRSHDCPDYETLINAATGNHNDNDMGDGYYYSKISDWDSSYLHFNGSDAHGEIPDEFWEKVELLSGKRISDRPNYFSCSC